MSDDGTQLVGVLIALAIVIGVVSCVKRDQTAKWAAFAAAHDC